MELHIENPDLGYPKAKLIEPTSHGYIYVAAAIHPNNIPVVLPNTKRSKLLSHLKQLARELERTEEVVRVAVFRAIVRPPTARVSTYLKEHGAPSHGANYDVLILTETTSLTTAREIQNSSTYRLLLSAIQIHAKGISIMVARNAKRIGDVDTHRKGLFLFNHFVAADKHVMLQLWDYLAGWYTVETHLDNSVALTSIEGEPSEYAIVNWARWDVSPVRHFWNQLAKKGFWKYVTTNLDANRAASLPVYCRLA